MHVCAVLDKLVGYYFKWMISHEEVSVWYRNFPDCRPATVLGTYGVLAVLRPHTGNSESCFMWVKLTHELRIYLTIDGPKLASYSPKAFLFIWYVYKTGQDS